MLQHLLERLERYFGPADLAWAAALVAALGLSTSKAAMSICTGFAAGAAAWYLVRHPRPGLRLIRPEAWLLTGIFWLSCVGGCMTDEPAGWMTDIRQKLPFLILPLAFGVFPRFSQRQETLLWGGFILTQTVVALLSLVIAYQDYEGLIRIVTRNSNIDIVGSVSHIYFGLFLAFSALMSLWLGVKHQPVFFRYERHLFLVLGVLNLIFLHLLTSRTGLIVVYVSGISGIIYLIFKTLHRWLGVLLLAAVVVLPVLSYQYVPSFRTRVNVTRYDLQQYQIADRDLSGHSISLRLLAWEAALYVWEQHPILGTGIADVEQDMQAAYTHQPQRASPSSLLTTPHNQYLEYLAGFGILGIGMLLIVNWVPLFISKQKSLSFLLLLFVIGIGVAMLFESILERQAGMTFVALFMMLLTAPDNPRLSFSANNSI
ncbi:MAG: O-antigen ligase family protein [Bacteroidia bacterium]|nr:O-antigen ligase family protein [Bacteroidia bacterium]